MENQRANVETLLEELEKSGECFIGTSIHREIGKCKYPSAWVDTLQRYMELISLSPTFHVQFYLDLCVTILTKRIITIDIHRIVGEDDPQQNVGRSDMRIIHAIMFKMTISRMLACICECVLKCPPLANGVVVEQTSKLYQRVQFMLKENFRLNLDSGKYYAWQKIDIEKTVHDITDIWLLHEALPNIANSVPNVNVPVGITKTKVLSSDLSFFGVSHCYWLWLHLTAAGIQTMKTEGDFLTMFYALDLFVFCPQCSSHFVRHKAAFYNRDTNTSVVTTTYTTTEIVYHMHNVVNKDTGKDILPIAVLSDYKGYWERYALLEAGN